MTTFPLGRATVEHNPQVTVTRFLDGTQCIAWHKEQEGQREQADELGLTVQRMNMTHDLTHSLLARMLGLPYSMTLYAIAHDRVYPHWRIEEKAVLGIQGYAAATGIDLIKLAEHYSRKD